MDTNWPFICYTIKRNTNILNYDLLKCCVLFAFSFDYSYRELHNASIIILAWYKSLLQTIAWIKVLTAGWKQLSNVSYVHNGKQKTCLIRWISMTWHIHVHKMCNVSSQIYALILRPWLENNVQYVCQMITSGNVLTTFIPAFTHSTRQDFF